MEPLPVLIYEFNMLIYSDFADLDCHQTSTYPKDKD